MADINAANTDAEPVITNDAANPANDGVSPADTQQQDTQTHDEPREPTKPVDPRDAIAARAAERRQAEEQQYEPTDTNFVPPHIAFPKRDEADPPDDNQQNPENTEAAPSDGAVSDSSTPYTLKVNGTPVAVSRADLLNYAEMDESEAGGIPDRALIKLAQQHIAAEYRLDQAKEIHRNARANAARGNQSDGDIPHPDDVAPNPEPQDTRNKPRTSKEVAEAIQFEDPENAGAILDEWYANKNSETSRQADHARRMSVIDNQIDDALAQFSQENPDLIANPTARFSLSAQATVETANEIAAKFGLNEAQVATLHRDPDRTKLIYQTAIAEGHSLRTPAEIFNFVGTKVRAEINRPAPTAPTSSPQANNRQAAKQNLTQQPNRGAPSPQAQADPASTEGPGRYKSAIDAMRRARGQSVAT